MTKTNLICINCARVQIRTDINIEPDKNYVFLKGKHKCPVCDSFTQQIATKDVKILRKKLTDNCVTNHDRKVLELIQR